MSLWKKIKKAAQSTYDAATATVEDSVNAVGKIATGNVQEGLGDLGETAMRSGLDVATGGNKGQADALTGGALSRAEQASRGNSEDIIATGVTLGATAYGGPTGGITASQILGKQGLTTASLAQVGLGTAGGAVGGALGGVLSKIGNMFAPQANASNTAVEEGYFSQIGGYDTGVKKENILPIIFIVLGLIFILTVIIKKRKKG